MNEIKSTPSPNPWVVDGEGNHAMVRDASGRIIAVRHRLPGNENEANMHQISASPDMAIALEMLAAEADAGTVMIPSALRLTIDAALIKAGRKAAPEPVRVVTIAGVDR